MNHLLYNESLGLRFVGLQDDILDVNRIRILDTVKQSIEQRSRGYWMPAGLASFFTWREGDYFTFQGIRCYPSTWPCFRNFSLHVGLLFWTVHLIPMVRICCTLLLRACCSFCKYTLSCFKCTNFGRIIATAS